MGKTQESSLNWSEYARKLNENAMFGGLLIGVEFLNLGALNWSGKVGENVGKT